VRFLFSKTHVGREMGVDLITSKFKNKGCTYEVQSIGIKGRYTYHTKIHTLEIIL
jgi:hypothetical protein